MINVTKRNVGSVVEWTVSSTDSAGRYEWKVRVVGDFATIRAKGDFFQRAAKVALLLKSLPPHATLREAYDQITSG